MTLFEIDTAPSVPDAGYAPGDDRRHRPSPGGRMRDSLFWQVTMPDEQLGFQAYLTLTGKGRAGGNIVVWGQDPTPLVLDLVQGEVADDVDLDNLTVGGLRLEQTLSHRAARLRYESDRVRLDYRFQALHAPFSYRQNPDGLPDWFALNRFEQTGRVTGFLEIAGRRIDWNRIGHRDHSWGMRDWRVPQHWKWFIAYTPDAARIVNGWIWIARGQWGFAGYVVRDGRLTPIARIDQHSNYDSDMTQRRLHARIHDTGGGVTEVTLERFGLVRLGDERTGAMVMEAACGATIDGAPAAGQFETQWSSAYLDQLAQAPR